MSDPTSTSSSLPSRTLFLPFATLGAALITSTTAPSPQSTFRSCLVAVVGSIGTVEGVGARAAPESHDQRAPRNLAPERAFEQLVDLVLDHRDAALALFPTRRGSHDAACRPGVGYGRWRSRGGCGGGGGGGGGSDTAGRRCKRRRCSVQAAPLFRFTLQQQQTESAREGPRQSARHEGVARTQASPRLNKRDCINVCQIKAQSTPAYLDEAAAAQQRAPQYGRRSRPRNALTGHAAGSMTASSTLEPAGGCVSASSSCGCNDSML